MRLSINDMAENHNHYLFEISDYFQCLSPNFHRKTRGLHPEDIKPIPVSFPSFSTRNYSMLHVSQIIS